ncbi:hypothetical protein [Streptomyces sp. NPDC090022]|uniref:hypothetical protein n=1 Tax=Streptomyces sp. NPDC090022 TaxID=3365920 RepID=UPI0037FDA986
MGPALLTAAVIVAAWIIRTAVTELRHPGTASVEWAFLRDTRALATGAAAACLLGLLGWLRAGAEGLVWALLASVLVTYAVSKLRA